MMAAEQTKPGEVLPSGTNQHTTPEQVRQFAGPQAVRVPTVLPRNIRTRCHASSADRSASRSRRCASSSARWAAVS